VKYTLDTNVFVDGLRHENGQAELLAFLKRALPFTYLSAVVMQELAAGARSSRAAREVEQGVCEPFRRRGRVFAPSSGAFKASGHALAAVARREGCQFFDENPSLLNDALIAASCREQGMTLITRDSDFKRLASFIKGFHYTAPWPVGL